MDSTRRAFIGAGVLLFVFTLISPAKALPVTALCREWNLAADFRVFPNQENPNRDSCGNLGVWSFLESDPNTFPAHTPSTYTLLPEFINDAFFIFGLEKWQGSVVSTSIKDKLPHVGINTTGATQFPRGIVWPPGVVQFHPLPNAFAAVGWKSPFDGAVTVTGGVNDLDNSCGNGILWFIDRFDGFTNTTLASGSIPEGGSQNFQDGAGSVSLASVTVNEGDFLYFLVDPKSMDHRCDSTGLNVIIRPTAAHLIIGEFRSRGPNGAEDEFVELYNNSDSPIIPGGDGLAVVAEDGTVRCIVPNTTIIPARGHFICAGAAYSLSAYAASNAAIASDIGDAQGVALFSTTNPANFTPTNRLDAFGYTSSAPLYREGGGYPYTLTYNVNQSIYRDLSGGTPKDTDDNGSDFVAVNADPHVFDYGLALGAPGPENLASPVQRNAQLPATMLDPTVGASDAPNRERNSTVVPNGAFGTLIIRRTFTNNTTQQVTQLRLRVIDITTRNIPASQTPGQVGPCAAPPCADLRVLSSADEPAIGTGTGPVSTEGLLLEEPPGQPNGGGFNSSLQVTLASPLPAGSSVKVNFRLGVQGRGSFRFFVNVEALP